MMRSLLFGAIWVGFIGYAFFLSPPDRPDTFQLIQDLSTGQWAGINPLVISVFNLMGIWPVIYSMMLLVDGRGQRFPAWPFAIASFAVGAFALLPYLALRRPSPTAGGVPGGGAPGGILKLTESRWLGLTIAVGCLVLLGYGLGAGDWGDFVTQWQTRRFIHVMSLDFCLLCGLVGALLGDDMARRGLSDRRLYWAIVLTPLLGIVAYLCFRPSLRAIASEPSQMGSAVASQDVSV